MLDDNSVFLQHIMYHASDMIFWKDNNLTYKGANLTVSNMTGMAEPTLMVGLTDFDMSWKEYADKYQNDDQIVLSGQSLETLEKIRTVDGITKIIWTKKNPIRTQDGGILGVVGFAKILTELQEQENSKDVNEWFNAPKDTIMVNPKLIKAFFFNISAPEAETLYFIIRGFSANHIATVLFKSTRTIEHHIERLKIKLDARCKQSLIHQALKYGFMSILPESLYLKLIKKNSLEKSKKH
tara:strand:- start:1240 stop:1956 length:717 start_codon:yes stop_codon:yes gene_type:complete